MRKQIAIVIDVSGSMFHPAAPDCEHDKIVEASESVQHILENIKNYVQSNADEWAVTIWRFAESNGQLAGQTIFDNIISDFTVDILKDIVQTIEDQANSQRATGNLTDIFKTVREVSDWMTANPPSWNTFPADGPPDKKTIFLFTDGNQTVPYGGSVTQTGYETNQGVDFETLLNDRSIVLNAQGIGSDLLNVTLDNLVNDAFTGSSVKVIATDNGAAYNYFADCSTAILQNALKAVNDNGVLSLRPVGGNASALLWEQFRLPMRQVSTVAAATTAAQYRQCYYKDFEVDVDEISQTLILGLTWHQSGAPSLEAVSPSGIAIAPGLAGSFLIQVGWMMTLHIPNPEAGTWRVRVQSDPNFSPLRLNLMARGINPQFKVEVKTNPLVIAQPGTTTLTVIPRLDNEPAKGNLRVQAAAFGGTTSTLTAQDDGTFKGELEVSRVGVNPVRVEVTGRLENGQSVQRLEFTTVIVGKPRTPRLQVQPRQYRCGLRYTVEVQIQDASFSDVTQIRFGQGIVVHRFIVLNENQARAEIEVLPTANPGKREVITFFPDAETLAGVDILCEEKDQDCLQGQICCLRFDAKGLLIGLQLCEGKSEGKTISIKGHDDRLQSILEQARDHCYPVRVCLDGQGTFKDISICK